MVSNNKKRLSLFLALVLLVLTFQVPVFGDNIVSFEGLVLNNDNQIQVLSLDGSIYNVSTESNKDVLAFCKVIANSGMKSTFSATLNTSSNSLNLLGITTAKELPSELQTQWNNYQIDTYGTYKELTGIITFSNNIYSFIADDMVYSPIKFEYTDVEVLTSYVANTAIKVNVESAVYNDGSILISYIGTVDPLPEPQKTQWDDYLQQTLKDRTKTGVIISYGSDSYMLVEDNTNKMYYLTTNDSTIYSTVPIIADTGVKVSLAGTEYPDDNLISITYLSTDTLPTNIQEQLLKADKERFESTVYHVDGYITHDGSDYNVHFTPTGEKEIQTLGIETNIPDVVKVIESVADDETVLLRLEGFVNYEQTVIDVRNVTFLVDLTEGETLKKLQVAFNGTDDINTETSTTGFAVSQNNTNANTNTNTGLFSSSFSDSFTNLFNSLNSTEPNSLFSNFYNNSNYNSLYNSLFSENTQPNAWSSDFSTLFNGTSFSNMNDLFNNFNSQMQNQSSLLTSPNFNNFDFENFQSAFNQMYSATKEDEEN